jgi:drug/metabolite transporter (DMT)-like permease
MSSITVTEETSLRKTPFATIQNFRRHNPQGLAWVILISLAFIWGSSFIQIKKAMEVFSPFQVLALRVSIASLFFLSFGWVFLKKIPLAKYKYLILAGLLGVVIPSFLFPLAQKGVNSSLTGVLNGLTPLFTWLIGWAFFGQRVSVSKLWGLLIGLIGAISLMLISSEGSLNFNAYALFALGATLANGIYLNLIKKYLSDLPTLYVTSVAIMLMSPLAIALLSMQDIGTTYQSHSNSGFALLYVFSLGIFATVLSSIIFNYLLQIATPIFASTVTYLMPIVAIIWGLLDGEVISSGQVLGILAVIGGVYLLNK